MFTRIVCAVASAAVLLACAAAPCRAQPGTAFTYQGRLDEAGAPAEGRFDLRFQLFDAPAAGTQVGTTVCAEGVLVADGLFTVTLDFGASAFRGGARWLQVGVRRDATPGNCGSGAYTTLSPRQAVSAAPYALHAARPWTTSGAGVSFTGGNVGIGAASPETLLQVGDDAVPNTEAMLRLESRSAAGSWQRRWEVGVPETGEGVGDGRGYSLTFDDTQRGATPEMTLRWGSGLLGLGTLDPQMSLQVETPSLYGSPALGCATGPQNSRDWAYLHVSDEFDHSLIWNAGKAMRFGTETSPGVGYVEHMRITADGKVGIGAPTPAEVMEVRSGGVSLTMRPYRRAIIPPTFHNLVKFDVIGAGGPVEILEVADSLDVQGNLSVHGQTTCYAGLQVLGLKFFVEPHPTDASKEIRFVCLEGNESGTYFRGTSRLAGGVAVIEVPEEFRLVTEPEGLTVQVTAKGPDAGLWVESASLDRVVVRGKRDVAFDYFVNGVRRGYAGHRAIRENHAYVPEVRGVPYGEQYPEAHRRILVENGILNPDFTPNEATAARMRWTLRDPRPEEQDRIARPAREAASR